MMDLVQVRSFVEVAERGTVVAAAAALGFTPPAVSQHLAKLETELGASLFDRTGQRLHLTEGGIGFVPLALRLLDVAAEARRVVGGPAIVPHFVIAGFASALSALVVPILELLDGRMTLDIVECEDAAAMRDLSLGNADLVLAQEYDGLPVVRSERFVFTPLLADELRLVMPPGFASTSTVSALPDVDWLLNGSGSRCAEATMRVLASAGLRPSFSGTVADNATLLALVAAGHGVSIVPELLLNESANVVVADEELGVRRTILAVHRSSAAQFVAPLLEVLGVAACASRPQNRP